MHVYSRIMNQGVLFCKRGAGRRRRRCGAFAFGERWIVGKPARHDALLRATSSSATPTPWLPPTRYRPRTRGRHSSRRHGTPRGALPPPLRPASAGFGLPHGLLRRRSERSSRPQTSGAARESAVAPCSGSERYFVRQYSDDAFVNTRQGDMRAHLHTIHR